MRVAVIGAGASGLMASLFASKSNDVVVFDGNSDAGKKLLLTGNGRCNIGNVNNDLSKFHSSNDELIKQVISEQNINIIKNVFENIGLVIKNKNGYLYPYSEKSSSVLCVLKSACINNNVKFNPESLKTRERRTINFKTLNPLSSLARLTKFKYIGALIAVIALSGFAQSMLHSTWTLFTNFRFNWTPFNIGLSLVVMGLVTAVVQGFLLKKLLKVFGEQKLILCGLGSGALAYLCFGLVTYGPLTYLVMFCNFLSVAVPPTLNSIVSHSVPASEQGEAMGTIASVNSLMGVAAPLLGTPLLVHTAAQSPGSLLGGLPYFICALVLALAAFIAYRHFISVTSADPNKGNRGKES